MRARNQVAVAIFITAAVLAVFVYPLTFGPPAPQQKYLSISSLLAGALAVVITSWQSSLSTVGTVELSLMHASAPSERLALICTRLC